MRRTAADAAETRALIIECARAAFTEKGFAGASTAEIAKRAGVTEGALFHHFKSKKAVFADVFATLQAGLTKDAQRAAQGAPLESFLGGCRAALQRASQPDYARIVMLDGPNVLGHGEWRRLDSSFGLATLESGLAAIVSRKALPQRLHRPMAVFLLGALNETAFALARGEDGVAIEDCLALIARVLAPLAKPSAL